MKILIQEIVRIVSLFMPGHDFGADILLLRDFAASREIDAHAKTRTTVLVAAKYLPYSEAMSLFDLLFLFCLAAAVITVGRISYLALRGRFRPARTTILGLLAGIAVYMLVLIGVSLAEPRKEIPTGEARCFDDWCITVEHASPQKAIGAANAAGTFYVETDIDIYLIDGLGRRIGISPSGQAALTKAGLADEPLTSYVAPGASFQSRLAFDVPLDARHLGLVKGSRGWFPVRLIIGDPQSWLHRPTVTPLD